MLKKVILFFFIILIFLSSYNETDGSDYISINNKEDNYIKIEKLIPHRGEQNIISTPEIKILYKSNYDLNNFKLYLNYKDITKKTIITSNYIYYKCDKKLKKGMQVARLELFVKDNKPKVIEWYFTVGTSFYHHYRGIFFNNTNDLNILTSYEDLNYLCKNKKHLNFLFITEKINNKKVTTDTFLNSKKWQKLCSTCDKYCNNYSFISIPGFELNSQLQHEKNETKINIFNCKTPFILKNNISFNTFYRKLFYFEEDLICGFSKYNNLGDIDYFKYSPYGDKVIFFIDLKKDSNNKLNLTSYKEALDNGWHVSPIICEYNQYPNADINNTFTTTILAEDLTKSQILDSIINRRIYISSNDKMEIYFSLNKMPMGSIIKNPSYIRIIASAIDHRNEGKIKKIDIISNNSQIIRTRNVNSNLVKLDFTLPLPDKNTYYFALITDENNNQTVTSPIWVEY